MKKPVVVLLHIGYWSLYVTLIGMLMLIGLQTQKQFTPERYLHLLLLSPATIFFFLSGILGFYSFYGIYFARYFQKRKILKLIIVGLSTCIISAFITSFFIKIMLIIGFCPF